MKLSTFFLIGFLLTSCGNNAQQRTVTRPEIRDAEPVTVPAENGKERAYFASGCFWCVEAIYEHLNGVEEVISGYAGGHTEDPTYEATNTGETGHAEAVEVIYDPKKISFRSLVEVFFGSQDPTQVDGQGPDLGSQYRSIAFFQNQEQKRIIEEVRQEVVQSFEDPIAVEILPFLKFWKAEAYHQDYKKKNPNNPYIKKVSNPRLKAFQKKFPNLLKKTPH